MSTINTIHQSLLEQTPPTAKINIKITFTNVFCTTCSNLHGHLHKRTSITHNISTPHPPILQINFNSFVDSQSKNSKENFELVNQNFARVRKNEDIIIQTLRHYENTIGSLSSAELTSEKASIITTLVKEAQSRKNTFLQKIGILSAKVQIPQEIIMIEILAREPNYCSSFSCYKNSISKIEQGKLQVITQKYDLHLQPRTLLSCALLPNNQLSAYHHGLAYRDGDLYSFQDKSLPPLHISPEKQHLTTWR